MAHPKAYDPQPGYKYQILVKTPYDRAYEHCDYAEDKAELKDLLADYRMSYGIGFYFKTITLPQKYWNN
ncbi:hypothetical protein MCCARTNEY_4 [Bacillus phage vB_BanH_McCartney]|nr:hypothetical protein MCCARTNEY_4 [Bacillus phage vB_BanH_McCartney]